MFDCEIKALTSSEAKSFLELLRAIDAESDFLMFEKNERNNDVVKCEVYLKKTLDVDRGFILVATDVEGRFVGHMTGERCVMNKKQHVMRVSIGVLKKYYGLGRALMDQFVKNVDEMGVVRLEGEIVKNNMRSLNLVKKFGFKIEGIKQHAICINGQYVDEYAVARIGRNYGNEYRNTVICTGKASDQS